MTMEKHGSLKNPVERLVTPQVAANVAEHRRQRLVALGELLGAREDETAEEAAGRVLAELADLKRLNAEIDKLHHELLAVAALCASRGQSFTFRTVVSMPRNLCTEVHFKPQAGTSLEVTFMVNGTTHTTVLAGVKTFMETLSEGVALFNGE